MKRDKNTTIEELKMLLLNFSKERQWEKNYFPNQLAKSIIIESAELLEIFQWDSNEESSQKIIPKSNKEKTAFEIIDVLYYLLMLAQIMKIDLMQYTLLKLKDLELRYPKV